MMGRNWMQRVTEAADLHGEAMPGVPLVELAGDRRVLIECHRGVTEYSPGRISVRVAYGSVCICGCGLELSVMTKERLVISGRIDSVALVRRDR